MRLAPPAFVMVCVLVATARADSPVAPYPYVAAAQGGQYYFKMIPASPGKPARGDAYVVNAEGPDRVSWSVSGWYSFATYLSADGDRLVRLGQWSFAGQPTPGNLGVAFYNRNQLVKQYSIKELVRDPSRAPRSVAFSHYLNSTKGIDPDTGRFVLTTCEGTTYTFDVVTGAILSRSP